MTENYRIGELAQKAKVTKRTIHYYISKGLLPPAKGAGVNSYYTDEHLYRTLLIKRFQDKYLPLEKIKEIITCLSLEEVKEKLEEEVPVGEPEEVKLQESLVTSYFKWSESEMDLWEEYGDYLEESTEYIRVELGLGVELHYPKRLEEERPGMLNSLVSYAKRIMEEE
ncbi:MAG: MerR family transcriptional regulator [Candidatus Syntrophonatronum acetioxidans]|uniref:MerR family transcriptional regulator n=1 Tax=Candidatus Syntrophonatronum acetioxidans TaxID=1795816 RepID=A0A424YH22_9FIRM|nr:MAG: MerR family transcriptional regulator [Candidatus Syntrophonatronum acetioxidans]